MLASNAKSKTRVDKMKLRIVVLVGLAFLMGRSVFAQDYDKLELSGNFSYASGNPANVLHHFALNGGGGEFAYNFNRFFGIAADLQGYGASTSTFTAVTVVNPLIVGTTVAPSVSASGNLFTYMAGPQFRVPTHTLKPFAECLFGGAHTNLYRNLYNVAGATNLAVSNNSFAMAIGGGFDMRLSRHISLRPFQLDYLLTSFKDTLVPGGNNHQNNWRYVGGINLTFGE
jgi:hypothetical protein